MRRPPRVRVRTRPTALGALGLGAVAGLAGGLAVILAQEAERRLGLGPAGISPWEAAVRHEARRRGRALSEPRVRALAAGSRLIYAAALGAGYGLARGRLRLPRRARASLLSALVYAMNFPRGPGRVARGLLSPVFGYTTATVYEALAER